MFLNTADHTWNTQNPYSVNKFLIIILIFQCISIVKLFAMLSYSLIHNVFAL